MHDADWVAAAWNEARLTHAHPLAADAAAAVVRFCRALLRGLPWAAALSLAAQGRLPSPRHALGLHQADRLSTEEFAPHALAAAVHFVSVNANFSSALKDSIRFAGPENYCPVLIGSLGGARWGVAGIEPAQPQHHGRLLSRLTAVANSLVESWAGAAAAGENRERVWASTD